MEALSGTIHSRRRRRACRPMSSRQPAATVMAICRGPRLNVSTVQPRIAYTVRMTANGTRGSRSDGTLHRDAAASAVGPPTGHTSRSSRTRVVTSPAPPARRPPHEGQVDRGARNHAAARRAAGEAPGDPPEGGAGGGGAERDGGYRAPRGERVVEPGDLLARHGPADLAGVVLAVVEDRRERG